MWRSSQQAYDDYVRQRQAARKGVFGIAAELIGGTLRLGPCDLSVRIPSQLRNISVDPDPPPKATWSDPRARMGPTAEARISPEDRLELRAATGQRLPTFATNALSLSVDTDVNGDLDELATMLASFDQVARYPHTLERRAGSLDQLVLTVPAHPDMYMPVYAWSLHAHVVVEGLVHRINLSYRLATQLGSEPGAVNGLAPATVQSMDARFERPA